MPLTSLGLQWFGLIQQMISSNQSRFILLLEENYDTKFKVWIVPNVDTLLTIPACKNVGVHTYSQAKLSTIRLYYCKNYLLSGEYMWTISYLQHDANV